MENLSVSHVDKRHRVSKACTGCKVSRRKCTGVAPCTHCTKRGIVCSFDDDPPRRRGPKHSTTLEAENLALRQSLKSIQNIIQSKGHVTTSDLPIDILNAGDVSGNSNPSSGRVTPVSGNVVEVNPPVPGPTPWSPTPQEEVLIDFFFCHCNAILPVVSKNTFFELLADARRYGLGKPLSASWSESKDFPPSKFSDTERLGFKFLFYTVICAAARSRMLYDVARDNYNMAKSCVGECFASPSASVVSALLILAMILRLFAPHSTESRMSALYAGFAHRMTDLVPVCPNVRVVATLMHRASNESEAIPMPESRSTFLKSAANAKIPSANSTSAETVNCGPNAGAHPSSTVPADVPKPIVTSHTKEEDALNSKRFADILAFLLNHLYHSFPLVSDKKSAAPVFHLMDEALMLQTKFSFMNTFPLKCLMAGISALLYYRLKHYVLALGSMDQCILLARSDPLARYSFPVITCVKELLPIAGDLVAKTGRVSSAVVSEVAREACVFLSSMDSNVHVAAGLAEVEILCGDILANKEESKASDEPRMKVTESACVCSADCSCSCCIHHSIGEKEISENSEISASVLKTEEATSEKVGSKRGRSPSPVAGESVDGVQKPLVEPLKDPKQQRINGDNECKGSCSLARSAPPSSQSPAQDLTVDSVVPAVDILPPPHIAKNNLGRGLPVGTVAPSPVLTTASIIPSSGSSASGTSTGSRSPPVVASSTELSNSSVVETSTQADVVIHSVENAALALAASVIPGSSVISASDVAPVPQATRIKIGEKSKRERGNDEQEEDKEKSLSIMKMTSTIFPMFNDGTVASNGSAPVSENESADINTTNTKVGTDTSTSNTTNENGAVKRGRGRPKGSTRARAIQLENEKRAAMGLPPLGSEEAQMRRRSETVALLNSMGSSGVDLSSPPPRRNASDLDKSKYFVQMNNFPASQSTASSNSRNSANSSSFNFPVPADSGIPLPPKSNSDDPHLVSSMTPEEAVLYAFGDGNTGIDSGNIVTSKKPTGLKKHAVVGVDVVPSPPPLPDSLRAPPPPIGGSFPLQYFTSHYNYNNVMTSKVRAVEPTPAMHTDTTNTPLMSPSFLDRSSSLGDHFYTKTNSFGNSNQVAGNNLQTDPLSVLASDAPFGFTPASQTLSFSSVQQPPANDLFNKLGLDSTFSLPAADFMMQGIEGSLTPGGGDDMGSLYGDDPMDMDSMLRQFPDF